MFSTWHLRVPHSNMYRRTSAMALLSPVAHGCVEDVRDVGLRHLARRPYEQALLLQRALDQRRHVVLRIAQLRDAARRADVAHELTQDVGQGVRPRLLDRLA